MTCMQAVSDIRGMEKLLLVSSTPATFACFFCWMQGFRACNKTVYCGHYTLLPRGHPLRQVLVNLNNPGRLKRDANSVLAPAPRTNTQLRERAYCLAGFLFPWRQQHVAGVECRLLLLLLCLLRPDSTTC